jgi:hypothetical protein
MELIPEKSCFSWNFPLCFAHGAWGESTLAFYDEPQVHASTAPWNHASYIFT